jgi:hypothetical protein
LGDDRIIDAAIERLSKLRINRIEGDDRRKDEPDLR